MDDKIRYTITVKLTLLIMMKMARSQQRWVTENDVWRVLVGLLHHLTTNVRGNQLEMHNCVCWELQVDETVLTGACLGNVSLSC